MNTLERRFEIIGILVVRRHTTARELAEELGVSLRTIQYDIEALTLSYPIYTKQGGDGGIFIGETYKPYNNTLTQIELDALCEMYRKSEGFNKNILFRILKKYGPCNLEL